MVFGLIFGGLFAIGVIPYFSPATILYIPSAIDQLTNPRGNGVLCFESCGPCASWGEDYLLFQDGCRIPQGIDDCNDLQPNVEWQFIDNKCIPENSLSGPQTFEKID